MWIEAEARGEKLTLSVGDTGIGISPEEQEAIFDEFHQVAAASPGSGLGLAITRKLARLQRGDVRVESELRKGSRFLVSLPAPGKPISLRDNRVCGPRLSMAPPA